MTGVPEEPYPTEDLDVPWLAIDRDGYMGVFSGWGPMPTVALRQDALPIAEIEPLILAMPRVLAAGVNATPSDTGSFVNFAERGFFCLRPGGRVRRAVWIWRLRE